MKKSKLIEQKLNQLFQHQKENQGLLKPYALEESFFSEQDWKHIMKNFKLPSADQQRGYQLSFLDDLICNEQCLTQLCEDLRQLTALKNQLVEFMHQVVAQQQAMLHHLQLNTLPHKH